MASHPNLHHSSRGSSNDSRSAQPHHHHPHGHDTDVSYHPDPATATNTTQQLDFYQAMNDFKYMFPNMDEEIIEQVLRANNGVVDATIDQLLTMSVDYNDQAKQQHNGVNTPKKSAATVDGPRLTIDQQIPLEGHTPTGIEDEEITHLSLLALDKSRKYVAQNTTNNLLKLPTKVQSLPSGADLATGVLSIDSPELDNFGSTDAKSSVLPKNNVFYSASQKTVPAKTASLTLDDSRVSSKNSVGAKNNADVTDDVGFTCDDDDTMLACSSTHLPPKMNLFVDHEYTCHDRRREEQHHASRSKHFSRWNPPLLGRLPQDFLRIKLASSSANSKSNEGSNGTGLWPFPSQQHQPMVSEADRRRLKEKVPAVEQHFQPSNLERHGTKERHHQHHRMAQQDPGVHQLGPALTSSQKVKPTMIAHGGFEERPTIHSSSSPEMNSAYLQKKMIDNERRRSEIRASGQQMDEEQSRILDDERLALALQNEEFLNELRSNQEFMQALEIDRMNATAFEESHADFNPVTWRDGPELDSHAPKNSELEGYDDDKNVSLGAFPYERESREDVEFRRQLKHMGGSSQKKFLAAAKQFFQRKQSKKKCAKAQLYPYAVNDGLNVDLVTEPLTSGQPSLREYEPNHIFVAGTNVLMVQILMTY